MDGRGDSIILIGFMGSGKSSTGVALSYRLQCTVLDTDKLIEKREGRSISEIFQTEGEDYFRMKETELLRELQEEKARHIYSAGGGTPLREENRELLGRLGTVVYLRVSPETVYERLKGDTTRPLLQGDDPMGRIRELLSQREDLYRKAADIVIEADDKNTTQAAEEIAGLLQLP